MKNWKYINGAECVKVGNSSHTKEEAKTKDEYFKILKFYQTQGYRTKAGEYNPNGSIKLHKGDDSVEIVLVGNSKVGNAISDKIKFFLKNYITMVDSKGEKIVISKDGSVRREAEPNKEFTQIYHEYYDSGEKAVEEFRKKGFKVENDTPAEYAKRPPKIVGGNSLPEELEKDVEKKDKEKVDEVKKLETMNRQKYNPGDEVTVKIPGHGSRRALVVRDEGNVIKVSFSENGQEVTALPSEVSNRKVGNSAYDDGLKKGKEDKRKGKLISAAGFDMHVPGFSKYSSQEKEEFKKGYYSSNDLTKDDVYKSWKTGNSKVSNSEDDKFAYVMREFEEGKLKTPDGKVVTDPAQAKAIAYSESKKTENGLARARNAIKK